MAGEFQVKVEGLDELEEMLNKRAPAEAKTALRRAIRKGLQVFQSAIENNAPVKTGKLKSEIEISSMATQGDDDSATGGIVGIVGPAQDVFYALFQEQGTVHEEAKPFIRPAFDAESQNVLGVFEQELQKQLEALESK